AFACTHFARHIDVRQEMHLYLDDTVTLAGFAASALDVETEAAGLVTACTGFLGAGKQVANRREQARVGSRVGARRATDRALVDIDDLVEMLDAIDAFIRGRLEHGGAVKVGGGDRVERAVDQGRLARTGHAG